MSNAGGLGVLGAAASPPDELDEWITRTRKLTDRPFGVDTLLPASVPDNLEGAGAHEAGHGTTATAGGGDRSLVPAEVLEARDRSLVPAEVLEARDRFMDAEGPRRPKREGADIRPRSPRAALVRDFFSAQLEVVLDHRVAV